MEGKMEGNTIRLCLITSSSTSSSFRQRRNARSRSHGGGVGGDFTIYLVHHLARAHHQRPDRDRRGNGWRVKGLLGRACSRKTNRNVQKQWSKLVSQSVTRTAILKRGTTRCTRRDHQYWRSTLAQTHKTAQIFVTASIFFCILEVCWKFILRNKQN